MKRKSIVFAAAVAAIFLTVPASLSAMPRNVLSVLGEAQDNEFIAGAGVSDMRHLPTARSIATIEARAEIARTLQSIVVSWQDYQTAADRIVGIDYECERVETLFHSISETIARATFPGSRVIYEYRAADGHYWVVMTITRNNAETTVTSAVRNAEAAVPAAPVAPVDPAAYPSFPQARHPLGQHRLSSDDALERMRQAFDRHFEN